jgi:hypothetical protein
LPWATEELSWLGWQGALHSNPKSKGPQEKFPREASAGAREAIEIPRDSKSNLPQSTPLENISIGFESIDINKLALNWNPSFN